MREVREVRERILLAVCVVAAGVAVAAQGQRPRAEVTPIVETAPAKAGAAVRLSLKVQLPADVHVQANKPRDPSLIPTVLTITPPAGVSIADITYPPPVPLKQKGRGEPLDVLGPEFTIGVRLTLATNVAGELVLPAVLRYQACNDAVCFPPARATTEWKIEVQR
jgi:thioredoxin:protein disulfide reductase